MNGNLAEKREELYTYDDYLSWNDGQRWEIIDGRAYLMAAPSIQHQRISGILHSRMFPYFEGKTCELFAAPFDVCLFPEYKRKKEEEGMVQPDLSVVCDPRQLDGQCCNGAPTLIVEILSPATSSYDCVTKFNKYKKSGVKEYWIVDPENKIVHVCMLQNPDDDPVVFEIGDTLSSPTFPGLEIPLAGIFPNE